MTLREPVRVLLVNDRASVGHDLQAILGANPRIAVIAAVDTLAAAVAVAEREQPNVVIVDDHLAATSGVQACRAISDVCPTARALLLVSKGGTMARTATVLAAAAGYVLRDLDTTAMRDAVLTVGDERRAPDPAGAAAALGRLYELATEGCRDRDVWCSPTLATGLLKLLGEGLSDHEIGEQLDIPIETVRDAVKSLAATLPALRQ